MRYPWLCIPKLVPARFTSWVWPGGIVVSRVHRADASERHRRHEEAHVRQHRRYLLVLALPVWGALWVWTVAHGRDGYRDHPWEIEARAESNDTS